MKKILVLLLLFCLFVCNAFAETYDETMIPDPINEDLLTLSCKTKTSEYTLTGIRFDLDDENMPVIIIKQKQKNISNRSINVSGNLWIFSHSPYASGGEALRGAGKHYKKDCLGSDFVWVNNKRKVNKDAKHELAPDEEYEFEYPYQIDSFSSPVYMYFITEENSKNLKWRKETLVVIPDKGTVKPLE